MTHLATGCHLIAADFHRLGLAVSARTSIFMKLTLARGARPYLSGNKDGKLNAKTYESPPSIGAFGRPGKPTDNAFIEAFNGRIPR
jgi:hypothetical protein